MPVFGYCYFSEVAAEITDSFEALAEEVRRRRDTLLAELETCHADQQMFLARQADSVENQLVDVTNCRELTKGALQHGNETEVFTSEMSKINQQHFAVDGGCLSLTNTLVRGESLDCKI